MNKYNPGIHHRHSVRLKGYDYSQEGLYFITICTQNREHFFGEIVNGEMQSNEMGKIVEPELLNLKNKYPNIDLHEYIIMPNHLHGILQIVTPFVATDTVGAGAARPNDNNADDTVEADYVPTLGNVVAYFKYQTTKQIGLDTKLWQRNYHEHIIRSQKSYETISEYIINNPAKWENDRFFQRKKLL